MNTVQLSNLDARLTFLALRYHLVRPGAELDPETKQPLAHGLREVAAALEPQLDKAVAEIELSGVQHQLLVAALAGTLNELKSHTLLVAGGGSSSPGFESTLRRLFPEVANEPDEATQLAGHAMALRRRLEGVTSAAPSEAVSGTPRSWWRFWRRGEDGRAG